MNKAKGLKPSINLALGRHWGVIDWMLKISIGLALLANYLHLRFFEGIYLFVTAIEVFVGFLCLVYFIERLAISKGHIFALFFILTLASFAGTWVVSDDDYLMRGAGIIITMRIFAYFYMAKFVFETKSGREFVLTAFFVMVASYFYNVFLSPSFLLENYFVNSSYNVISAFLIFILASCLIVLKDRLVQFICCLVVVFICVVLYTRSSIFVSLFLTFWFILFRFDNKILPIILASILLLLGLYFEVLVSVYEATKFASSGLDSPRWSMWKSYYLSQDWQTFLIGIDLSTVDVIKDFNSNPHNSFINFHSNFGAFG